MKRKIYKRYRIQPGLIIIGLYLITALLAAVCEPKLGEAVYAMTGEENTYSYVRTLGHNTIAGLDKPVIQPDLFASPMIMKEQNTDMLLENSIKLYIPTTSVGGMKVVMRDAVEINKKEMDILCRIVEAEAGGEDTAGRMLVANVVLNRMKESRFPDTVKGVVFANDGHTYQFSPVSDGRFYSVNVSKETKSAVKRALAGEDNSCGAEYFMCRRMSDGHNIKWFDTKLKFLFKHGCHEFFKK